MIFVSLIGCSGPTPAPQQQKITELSKADRAELEERETAVLRLLLGYHADAALTRDESALEWLQRLVDEKAISPDRTYELESLGAVLGQVFVAKTPLRWVVVDHAFGRNLALKYPKTSIIVFPMTMISKRVENGRDVDVAAIYRAVVAQIERMSDDAGYRR